MCVGCGHAEMSSLCLPPLLMGRVEANYSDLIDKREGGNLTRQQAAGHGSAFSHASTAVLTVVFHL